MIKDDSMKDIKEIWSIKKIEKVLTLIKTAEKDNTYVIHYVLKNGDNKYLKDNKYLDVNKKYYNIVAGMYVDEIINLIQYLIQNGDIIYDKDKHIYRIVKVPDYVDSGLF